MKKFERNGKRLDVYGTNISASEVIEVPSEDSVVETHPGREDTAIVVVDITDNPPIVAAGIAIDTMAMAASKATTTFPSGILLPKIVKEARIEINVTVQEVIEITNPAAKISTMTTRRRARENLKKKRCEPERKAVRKMQTRKKSQTAVQNEENTTSDVGALRAVPSLLDQDLFGSESASPAAASPANIFDPFSPPAASVPSASVPQQNPNVFDAFSSPQQAQAQMNPFSPPATASQFASSSKPQPSMKAVPQQQQYAQQMNFTQSLQDGQQYGNHSSGFGNFQSATPLQSALPPQGGQQFGSNSIGFGDFRSAAPSPQAVPPRGGQQHGTNSCGFGDFQSATSPQPAARPNPPEKINPNDAWGAGSNLFDLNSLKSNSSTTACSGNRYYGFDGMTGMTSKPVAPSGMMQQPMSGGIGPMGGMQPAARMKNMGGMNYQMAQQSQSRGNMNMSGGMPPPQQFNRMGMTMDGNYMMGQSQMSIPQHQMNMRPQMGDMKNNMYGGNMEMQSSPYGANRNQQF